MSDDLAAAAVTGAEQYRKLASQLRTRARREDSSRVRAEFESLAKCYMLLAERADRRGGAAIVNNVKPERSLGA